MAVGKETYKSLSTVTTPKFYVSITFIPS